MQKQRMWRVVGTGIVVLGIASLCLCLRRETVEPRQANAESENSTALFFVPGIRQPPTRPALAADVEDDAEVIGVSVHGRHRAYCMGTLANPERHVVNDLIDRVPVTVTYCPRTNCVRALTQDDESDEPLGVVGRGWSEGKMMIWVAGKTLPQDSEIIPGLNDMSFETTTWKEWKTAHPDTDVYTGPLVDGGDA